ncbi:MAG TPA: phosphoadenylyl-sulfate reductase [Xanthomonadaceae bacterium]|nr:phosphoadenylyl-sulfate reductase [Xanthomonadaceae bacterium]
MTQAQTQTETDPREDSAQPWFDLAEMNRELEVVGAEQRVNWALENFPGRIVLTSSFGAQSAVCLHMVTRQQADVPVVLIDTGYLFPETYRFIDELSERLSLNLQIYRAQHSPAWQEARYGKLWEQGLEGIERYNWLNKVEPMQRALRELGAMAWISGLRRQQAKSRQQLDVLLWRNGRCKVHPLIDWTDRDVYRYLTRYNLPYHPLWEQGYVSIGDVHTTRRLVDGMSEEETRFFGLKRECGLHEHV